MLHRYVLEGHEVKEEPDLMTWSSRFEKEDRQVADDMVNGVRVSTVFLGLDHNFGREGPPILFETMVFGGPLDGEQWRYETWEQAEAGHKEVMELVSGQAIRKIRFRG